MKVYLPCIRHAVCVRSSNRQATTHEMCEQDGPVPTQMLLRISREGVRIVTRLRAGRSSVWFPVGVRGEKCFCSSEPPELLVGQEWFFPGGRGGELGGRVESWPLACQHPVQQYLCNLWRLLHMRTSKVGAINAVAIECSDQKCVASDIWKVRL